MNTTQRQYQEQPGEARGDERPEDQYLTWLSCFSKMTQIKAGWILQAAPEIQGLEDAADQLPDGEERRAILSELKKRYKGLLSLWLDGTRPGAPLSENS